MGIRIRRRWSGSFACSVRLRTADRGARRRVRPTRTGQGIGLRPTASRVACSYLRKPERNPDPITTLLSSSCPGRASTRRPTAPTKTVGFEHPTIAIAAQAGGLVIPLRSRITIAIQARVLVPSLDGHRPMLASHCSQKRQQEHTREVRKMSS